jgi:hypothetical protein
MSREQRQIIIGTLLGKSFIVKLKGRNCFLTMPESQDINWLNYKANIIDDSKNVFIKDKKRILWRSKCKICWNQLHDEIYENNKKIVKMKMLDELRDDGLCAWFLDKGKFLKKQVCLGTTAFGLKGNKIIAQYFNEVGIPCKIKKERNTGKILFTKKGTEIFLATIVRAVPQFMYYRMEP